MRLMLPSQRWFHQLLYRLSRQQINQAGRHFFYFWSCECRINTVSVTDSNVDAVTLTIKIISVVFSPTSSLPENWDFFLIIKVQSGKNKFQLSVSFFFKYITRLCESVAQSYLYWLRLWMTRSLNRNTPLVGQSYNACAGLYTRYIFLNPTIVVVHQKLYNTNKSHLHIRTKAMHGIK